MGTWRRGGITACRRFTVKAKDPCTEAAAAAVIGCKYIWSSILPHVINKRSRAESVSSAHKHANTFYFIRPRHTGGAGNIYLARTGISDSSCDIIWHSAI